MSNKKPEEKAHPEENIESEPTLEKNDFDNEIEQMRKEASDYKHKYLHQLADAENSRKRLQKDRDEIIQYAIRSLILDFLHPIDHLENALRFAEESSDEVKHWAKGFEMILSQFKDILAGNGVKPINAKGKPFDPHLHDAIEMLETTDTPPGIVVEETSRGYTIGEKTLRPSRVKVSKAPNDEIEKLSPEAEEVQEENS